MNLDYSAKTKIMKDVKEDVGLLERELDNAMNHLLPLVNEYLKDVRAARMAFANEIIMIVQSTRQLNEITKTAPELIKLGDAVSKLKDILTPEFTATLEKLTRK